MRILIVEDEAKLAEGLKRGLESKGFAVDWIAESEKAMIMPVTRLTRSQIQPWMYAYVSAAPVMATPNRKRAGAMASLVLRPCSAPPLAGVGGIPVVQAAAPAAAPVAAHGCGCRRRAAGR